MPIFRYLILALAIWLAFQIIRRMLRQRLPPAESLTQQTFVDTVACQHCGLHIPRREALTRGDQHYCCPQHRDAD